MSSDKGDKGARSRPRTAGELTRGFRGIVVFLFSISGIINVLALTGSIYMLQIYDRALTSGSVPTLLALSLLAIGLYIFQGIFDILRSQVLVRVGGRLDRQIAPMAHRVAIDMPRFGFSTAEALERGRDVDTVRGFLGSQGPVALFDLPWMPLYILFVYMLHPYLGALTLGGAFVLALLTIATELMTRGHAAETHRAAILRNQIADSNARNAEVLKAMGFAGRAVSRFTAANAEHLALQTRTSDVSGTFGAISRVLRMLLQSAILGLGAYLTIQGNLSAGAIIAASVASARALAPVDLAIGNWKNFAQGRSAWRRLKETAVALSKVPEPMELPAPARNLKVEKLTVAAPATGRVLLSDVEFQLDAGQALGVIGPSGGGKTTLVRALTGIWPALRGSVRLDDSELTQWRDEVIGRHIGYLPQEVALLDGTIEENICRFDPEADPRAIVEAARAAGVHEMIVRMPDGYHTQLGAQGMALSAGQRQRIGLARALYGNPFLVVMDEPNSNLDAEGEAALTSAILAIRARCGIAIVVAHRPSALAAVEIVAVVQNGKISAIGPKNTILQARPQAQVANLDTVVKKARPSVNAKVSA
ncbi:type I secretion system permease/ATPase [Aminobacter aganoensis]|uniref:ATP-binding cassette subfamily C protein n=1 Tax=Aminobacter aganoensis TaxID=83264 RepID=A0A7X0FC89_9HYPH|nr:type I secretion system permease/ATPase [Aminobacter aganoensis]MBB6357011.1 ATP-binding cassette subfamily C protein [Aminobacter aganoensis]